MDGIERIAESDLTYLHTLTTRGKQLEAEQAALSYSAEQFLSHLAAVYQLEPPDVITAEGVIVRPIARTRFADPLPADGSRADSVDPLHETASERFIPDPMRVRASERGEDPLHVDAVASLPSPDACDRTERYTASGEGTGKGSSHTASGQGSAKGQPSKDGRVRVEDLLPQG